MEQYDERNREDSYIVTNSNQKQIISENKLKRNFHRKHKHYDKTNEIAGTFRVGGIGKQLRAKRRKLSHSPDRRPPPFKIKAHKVGVLIYPFFGNIPLYKNTRIMCIDDDKC